MTSPASPTSASPLPTRITQLFGVRHPIVQTGMGWVAYPPLVSAVSNAGGLGILAGATLSHTQMREAIDEIQAGTSQPFGVNLRTDAPDIHKRIDTLISAGVKVASFAQAPQQEHVDKLKSAGVVTIPTIGARRHAEKVAAWGVDAVIAQGAEGGGHTGSVPTFMLLGQVLDAVDLPVVIAGGITDGRGVAAALAFGASGVAMGTRFLLSAESQVPDHIKQLYFEADVGSTVVTKSIDGAPQRVIRTKIVERLERAGVMALPMAIKNALAFRRLTSTSFGDLWREGWAMRRRQKLPWRQVAMAANAPLMTKAALVDGHFEVGILPTGMGLGVIDSAPACEQLISEIVDAAVAKLRLPDAGVSASPASASSVPAPLGTGPPVPTPSTPSD